jgi:hypothetical protein
LTKDEEQPQVPATAGRLSTAQIAKAQPASLKMIAPFLITALSSCGARTLAISLRRFGGRQTAARTLHGQLHGWELSKLGLTGVWTYRGGIASNKQGDLMKKIVALAVFLFPVIGFAAPAPQAANYNIPVHVTQSTLVLQCSSGLCNYVLHLKGTIAGKKVEVVENRLRTAVLHPGDYKARVAKTGNGKTRTGQTSAAPTFEDTITYELLLPDGTTRQYLLIGEEE